MTSSCVAVPANIDLREGNLGQQNALAAIQGLLAEDAYLEKRRRFKEAHAARFAPFMADLDAEIARLRAAQDALPLYLFDALPPRYLAELQALAPDERGILAKELVAVRLDTLPAMLRQWDLPASIVEQYLTAAGYMTRSIVADPDAEYGEVRASYFDRDLRMASGLSVPAGAQILDLRVWAPPTLYRNQGLKENLRCLSFVKLQLGGLGPLVRIHTDSRNLVDFNEEGWNACYGRIAQLMQSKPDIRGMIGTSWFYDPQLQEVSPKLAYLARVPLDNGAFLRIDGPGEIHTQRATERSPTRKRLYEEGKYKPVCATLIWPRKPLIEFARKHVL